MGAAPPAPGLLAFAQSADGQFYVAEVISHTPDAVRVKFLQGSEHTVSLDQIRPCAFIPGEKVMVDWPWWGPWTCTVVSYDAATGWVKVNDGWGYTKSFPIAEVWQAPAKRPSSDAARLRVYALFGAGVGLGAVIATIATVLVMR